MVKLNQMYCSIRRSLQTVTLSNATFYLILSLELGRRILNSLTKKDYENISFNISACIAQHKKLLEVTINQIRNLRIMNILAIDKSKEFRNVSKLYH